MSAWAKSRAIPRDDGVFPPSPRRRGQSRPAPRLGHGWRSLPPQSPEARSILGSVGSPSRCLVSDFIVSACRWRVSDRSETPAPAGRPTARRNTRSSHSALSEPASVVAWRLHIRESPSRPTTPVSTVSPPNSRSRNRSSAQHVPRSDRAASGSGVPPARKRANARGRNG